MQHNGNDYSKLLNEALFAKQTGERLPRGYSPIGPKSADEPLLPDRPAPTSLGLHDRVSAHAAQRMQQMASEISTLLPKLSPKQLSNLHSKLIQVTSRG
jgi:hypothetical protein